MSNFSLINKNLAPVVNPLETRDKTIIKDSNEPQTIKKGQNKHMYLLDRQILGGAKIFNNHYIGGSSLNKIKTNTKTKNYINKLSGIKATKPFTSQIQEIFAFGNEAEPIILSLFELFHGFKLAKNLNTIIDSQNIISGTFDAIKIDYVNRIIYIVDAKCSQKKIISNPAKKYIGLYETHEAQIQIYMYLALNFYVPHDQQKYWKVLGYLAVLNYNKHYFFEVRYDYNPKIIAGILGRVKIFQKLLGNNPK